MITLLATAAIYSCPEYLEMVKKVMATEMNDQAKAEVIIELAKVTEFGCFAEGDVRTTDEH